MDAILSETYDHSHVFEIHRGGNPFATPESREVWQDLHDVFMRYLYEDTATCSAAMRAAVGSVSSCLRRNIDYLHSIIGVDRTGRIVNLVAQGTLEDLGNRLAAMGCVRAVCVENSGSVMTTYINGREDGTGVPLLRAPNFREAGRALIAVVLEEDGFQSWPIDDIARTGTVDTL